MMLKWVLTLHIISFNTYTLHKITSIYIAYRNVTVKVVISWIWMKRHAVVWNVFYKSSNTKVKHSYIPDFRLLFQLRKLTFLCNDINNGLATHSFKYAITNYINYFLFIKLEKPVSCLFAEFSVSVQFYRVMCFLWLLCSSVIHVF